ncbi:ADP-ribosylation factor family-domain-containing protein [Aspergillus aurantiobrunneus]
MDTRFTLLDTGGLARPPLPVFFSLANGIVFVVDAADADSFCDARRMLWEVLEIEELKGVLVVILGNKIDHCNAVSLEEFLGLLGLGEDEAKLDSIRQERALEVVMGSVRLGCGTQGILNWLSRHV